jgi:hypothetical protein
MKNINHALLEVALDRATVELATRLAPDKSPNPADSEREVWMKAGAARLAKHLETLLELQERNVHS